jgi:hypothetical protein
MSFGFIGGIWRKADSSQIGDGLTRRGSRTRQPLKIEITKNNIAFDLPHNNELREDVSH